MDIKSMFPNMSAIWVRYSEYRIADDHSVEYIMPAEGAAPISYGCTEHVEQMLVDALNAGQQVFGEKPDAAQVCLDFYRKYGPLGLPLQRPNSQFFSGDRYNEGAAAAGVSPVYNGVFSKSYGEPLSHIQDTLRTLYVHFLSAQDKGKVPLSDQQAQEIQSQESIAESLGMRYRLTFGETPELIWEPESLLAVLKLAYALAVTDKAEPLKICKHCHKSYYNPNAKSEFCSVKCRNHYNVLVFRKRNKEQTD